MCAIIDANVAHEVFAERSEAGSEFLKWLSKKGVLAIGGNLRKEIAMSCSAAVDWLSEGARIGGLIVIEDKEVNDAAKRLDREGVCKSNDAHVIALAQVSGARLLYSNDRTLHQDFKNRELLNSPRGKVYSTLKNKRFLRSHRELLNENLCARQ